MPGIAFRMAIDAFTPPQLVRLPVKGESEVFPVRQVYGVGRNYASHALEMGGNPEREPPFFFTKGWGAAYVGCTFSYPRASARVEFEVELVVALGRAGKAVSVGNAKDLIYGYTVGIDMTRRDLQAKAKRDGRPWEPAKAFVGSAPCACLVKVEHCGHVDSGFIWLDVNGQRRQEASVLEMTWKIPEIIAELSQVFDLYPGDLIFTGTPRGVGPVVIGDQIRAGMDGLAELSLSVVGEDGKA